MKVDLLRFKSPFVCWELKSFECKLSDLFSGKMNDDRGDDRGEIFGVEAGVAGGVNGRFFFLKECWSAIVQPRFWFCFCENLLIQYLIIKLMEKFK